MGSKKKSITKTVVKVPVKLISILFSFVVVLLVSAGIFLSVMFPNELVRKRIEKEGTKFLGTRVRLKKLKFSIFSGLELTGLTVAQKGSQWGNRNIVSLGSAKLKYRILPLFIKVVSIKALVIEDGKLYLKRTKKGSNWDYFTARLAEDNKKKSPKKKKKTKNKKAFSKNQFPLDVNIKKVGIDGLDINYTDSTFLDVPVKFNIKDFKLLARSIYMKENKPLKLNAGINLDLGAGKYLNLGAKAKAVGKLKLFDNKTGQISPTGPIKIKLIEGEFSSKKVSKLFGTFVENFLGDVLGPTIKSAIKDPDLITKSAEKHFNSVLKDSKGAINKKIEKANSIMKKKEGIINYGKKTVVDFENSMNSSVNEIDSKINKIDSKVGPVLKTASKMSMLGNTVNLDDYKKRVKKLKNDSIKKKNNLTSKYKNELNKKLNSRISKSFPKKVPTYNEFKKKFDSKVKGYKRELNKKIKTLSINSFVKSLLPDMSFLEKKCKIESLSTIYELGKKESTAKDFDFSTDYFDLKGNLKKRDKYVKLDGNISSNIIEKLKLDFIPGGVITSKVIVKGNLPNLSLSLKERPKLKLDSSKKKGMVQTVINNYLKNGYGKNEIISAISKDFSIKDVNAATLKKNIDGDKNTQLSKFTKEKDKMINNIDKEVNKIIKDLERNVPGM